MFSLMMRPVTGRLVRPAVAMMLGAAVLAGCTVGPNYQRPGMPIPRGWVGTGLVSTTNPASQPSLASAAPAQLAEWWTSFHDPELDSLVARAATSNLTLRQAGARIRQARAVRAGSVAGLFPQVNATGSYRRSRTGGTVITGNSLTPIVVPGGGTNSGGTNSGGTGSGGTTGGTTSGGTTSGGTTTGGTTGAASGGTASSGAAVVRTRSGASDLFQAGFDASWELDVFGGVRRGIEASTADLQAAIEDQRDVLVTLLSEVAVNYLDLRGFQQQILLAQQSLESQQQTLELTRRLFAGGLKAGLDVANAEALVATTGAQIPVLQSQAQQSIYALSVLMGRDPAALLRELSEAGPIPATPPIVPIGLPSALLLRRPDVRRSERQLAAATARIGVATADLFPRISLTGSLNEQGTRFGTLGQWDNRAWSFGPSFSWPILDFGRIQSNIEVQNAVQEEALYVYEQTVLTAFQDVENSLVAYGKEQQHRRALADAVAANQRAVTLSTRLYSQGLTDFLNVLDAQRSLYSSKSALVQSDMTVSTNLVSLYKSLGGGWTAGFPADQPAPPATRQ